MFDRLRLKTKGYVVRDNFLPRYLVEEMRNFSLWDPRVTEAFSGGYFSKDFDQASDSLFTIKEIAEYIQTKSSLLRDLVYDRAWSFVYNQKCPGVESHADPSTLQVNLWVTPNKAIADNKKNGLILYERKAPKEWSWRTYNKDTYKIGEYLKGSKYVRIPHKYNRAVIFPGNTFHKTDSVHTISGAENRRVNYTFLYQ